MTTKKKTKKTKKFKVTVKEAATTQAPSSADAATTTQAPSGDAQGATTTEDVTEFALLSVESAVDAVDGKYKYLLVKFSKKIASLTPSEVELRRKSDDQLYSIEAVDLATDGMSAKVTLLGDAAATGAANIDFLYELTTYTFRVNKTGEKPAVKDFVIPAKVTDKLVTAVDPAKATITVGGNTINVSADGEVSDYFDILGRKVSTRYDINKSATAKVKYTEITAINGAFEVAKNANADGSYTITDKNTKKTYNTPNTGLAGLLWTYGAGYKSIVASGALTAGATYSGRIMFAENGTLTRVISFGAMTPVYVDKCDGAKYITDITGAEKSYTDFTYVKDFKYATIKDVTNASTIFVDNANKVIFIYNNASTCNIASKDAVFSDRVVLGSDTYKYDTDLTEVGIYIDKKAAAASEANFNKLKAGGDITVYKSITGAPVFILGSAGAVATNDYTYILTSKGIKVYGQAVKNYIIGDFSDGSNTYQLNQEVSKLKYIEIVGGSKVDATNGTMYYSTSARDDIANTNGSDAVSLSTNNGAAGTVFDIPAGSLVTLTKDAYGNITKIVANIATTHPLANSTDVKVGSIVSGGNNYTSNNNTPVYLVTFNGASVSKVEKTTLGKYTNKTKSNAQKSFITVDGLAATNVVVDTSGVEGTTTNVAYTKEMIITDIVTTGEGNDRKIYSLSGIITGSSDAVEYKSFFDTSVPNKSGTPIAIGDIASVGFTADNKIVNAEVAKVTDSATVTINAYDDRTSDSTTLKVGGHQYKKQTDESGALKSFIYKKDGSSYTLMSWDDVVTDVYKIKTFSYSRYQGTAFAVSTAIVEFNAVAADPILAQAAHHADSLTWAELAANSSTSGTRTIGALDNTTYSYTFEVTKTDNKNGSGVVSISDAGVLSATVGTADDTDTFDLKITVTNKANPSKTVTVHKTFTVTTGTSQSTIAISALS